MTPKLTALLPLALLGPALAQPTARSSKIPWSPCEQQLAAVPVTCANLTVPLDYTNAQSNQTLTLSLIRVSAGVQPSKGSILLNPGGPGISGLGLLNGEDAEPLLVATGGHYDLISWDPRGVGNTLPFSCYSNTSDLALASAKMPTSTNVSDVAPGTAWATWGTMAQACYENDRETGELLSTAFVARDMMQIVDALQEDGLLRYWGFSYGTALGMTVAAMFPDRMDKIILDGVLNPHQYYSGYDIQQVHDADLVFSEFFKGCAAAPEMCALARPNVSASDLEQQILDLLDQIKQEPIAIGPAETASIIDYGLVKSNILGTLHNPIEWPAFAVALNDIVQGNATTFYEIAGAATAEVSASLATINSGIRCGDNSLQFSNLSQILPVIAALYNESTIVGDAQALTPLGCSRWIIQPKERYQGGFDCIKTKNPILFIGNTYDPSTPLVSAQNASAAFEGSVVLQHDGHGHTSLGQPSLCTAKVVRAFFEDGTLPAPGTVCEPTVPLFSNETMEQAWAPIANFTKRDLGDDAALLRSLKQLSGARSRARL